MSDQELLLILNINERCERIETAIERLAEYLEIGAWSGVASDIRQILNPKPLQD